MTTILLLPHQDHKYMVDKNRWNWTLYKKMIVPSAWFFSYSFIISPWDYWNINGQIWQKNEPIVFTIRLNDITYRCWCQSLCCIGNNYVHCLCCVLLCRGLYRPILPITVAVTFLVLSQSYECVIKQLPQRIVTRIHHGLVIWVKHNKAKQTEDTGYIFGSGDWC